MEGGCTCGTIRYQMQDKPMFVHACHCSWCQRETGSAFALNAIIERDRLEVTGPVEMLHLPSASGQGQEIARCPTCRVAVFSHYAGAGRAAAFVRVGTLDHPETCPPDVHIFTSTRLPWVATDPRVPEFEGYYSLRDLWPPASQERRQAMKARFTG